MANILVFLEHQNNQIRKTSLEVLAKASSLAKTSGGHATAVLVGTNLEGLVPQAAPYGAIRVVLVNHPSLEKYNSMAYAEAIASVVEGQKAHIVLGSASPVGRDLFARLAMKLQAGLASECVDLRMEEGCLVAKKPIYSGKALVDVTFNSPIQMATTRPNSFVTPPPVEGAVTEIQKIDFDPGELKAPLKEVVAGVQTKIDLTEAEIIVSGGRAMGNSDNFKILTELAEVLHATVGASRAAVDSGYATHDMQVGQTGKVVNPKLYIACGISGAIQHLAGMRTSKVIVAINRDPEAPIFSKADYGIVGDLFTVVPLLTQELKKTLE